MIEPAQPGISISRQCRLLGISRSSWYYEAMGETAKNLEMMHLIDEQFMEDPSYGARQDGARSSAAGSTAQPQTGTATHALDGSGCPVPEAQDQHAASLAQDLSLFAQRSRDYRAQSRVVRRRDVYPDEEGISVFGDDHGLGLS